LFERPTILDVIEARRHIAPYVTRTPLHHYPSLDKLIGGEVHVKHENHHLVGSFKIRGALNVIAQLTPEEKRGGVVVSSTGNFGQGIAYAAGVFGVEATVVVPEGSNPDKVAAMRARGANVLFHGRDFDEARGHAERLAEDKGVSYIHSANEPNLISGVGTFSLEIVEDLPAVEVIIVPVGGGSGASGACIVTQALAPQVEVIGVQAASAPAAYLSWKEGRVVESKMETVAEGLATRSGYELTQGILRDRLTDFILVSEAEMARAVVLHLENTHNLTEHAGAASLAGAIKIKDRLQGRRIALVVSGGNMTLDQLKAVLS
jgi:threonine dehydratase